MNLSVLAQPYFTKETFLNLWFCVAKDSYGENESLSYRESNFFVNSSRYHCVNESSSIISYEFIFGFKNVNHT